jgi:3-phosphoshikimate 1-carboxyvinyltransferase
MSLPDFIEIQPLDKPVHAEITVPGSKSITNRALILAALADGEVTLKGALWSDDTQVMVEALKKLGFQIKVEPDPDETCNRTITVKGLGGKILPPGGTGTTEKPLELFVGNAGTAARFLAAFVCLGKGVYRLHGVPRMHERPQAALFQALRQLGYRVDSPNGKLPAIIHGAGPKPGAKCNVSIEESSQFASAILLCRERGHWELLGKVEEKGALEAPYVIMTAILIRSFPKMGGTFKIEADSSSGSYFQAANWLLKKKVSTNNSEIKLINWPESWIQVDSMFANYLSEFEIPKTALGASEGIALSRKKEFGDSIMTAMIIAPFALRRVRFLDLGRLRVQESDRLVAMYKELRRCGTKVEMHEKEEILEVSPCGEKLHGAEIETYDDHRMAMCFAVLGLKVPGIKIKNPACVKKTFPNFFQKLAAPPPKGLGATILDVKTGRKLAVEELFAD